MSEFNLLDEQWILVRDIQGKSKSMSLKEIFQNADMVSGLSNELPALDVAILRLLLAISHAAIQEQFRTQEDAVDFWVQRWEKGLHTGNILQYLEKWKDRFYLFDSRYPFYQVPNLTKGTRYDVPKLIGTISESGNKVRQFSERDGEGKYFISDAEAARWLIHLNAYDDTSAKPTKTDDGSKRLSPGAGWLGKIGPVYAEGENLEETLLLNLVLADENGSPWDRGTAAWELDIPKEEERTLIDHPKSQVELLTLQSRRTLLLRDGKHVSGYILLGGDFFEKENAFCEQMTLWRLKKDGAFVPQRHEPDKQLWRDFLPLATLNTEGHRPPGIVRWLNVPKISTALDGFHIRLSTGFVSYADKDFFVIETGSDSITMNAKVLTSLGGAWTVQIAQNLASTDDAITALGTLASDITEACGSNRGSKGEPSLLMNKKRAETKAQAYFHLDSPFRSWLAKIDPSVDNVETKCEEWVDIVFNILAKEGEALISQAPLKAIKGRILSAEDKEKVINAPLAYNKFLYKLTARLKKGEELVNK